MYPTPYSLPHRGLKFLEYYGRHNAYHPGVDLNNGHGSDDLGQEIRLPTETTVTYVSPLSGPGNDQNSGFGNFIVLHEQTSDRFVRFAHLLDINPDLLPGSRVPKDTVVGHLGKSGTESPHLHMEVWLPSMYVIQQNVKTYTYYPVGKSKAWVNSHYVDPLVWLEKFYVEPWKADAEAYAASVGIVDVPALVASHPQAHRWIEFVRKAVLAGSL